MRKRKCCQENSKQVFQPEDKQPEICVFFLQENGTEVVFPSHSKTNFINCENTSTYLIRDFFTVAVDLAIGVCKSSVPSSGQSQHHCYCQQTEGEKQHNCCPPTETLGISNTRMHFTPGHISLEVQPLGVNMFQM